MKTGLIITHNGNAHFDEFLAVSLILAVENETHFYIERRDPTEDELNDPQVYVVDIGLRHEPERRNFDHHQDLNIPASFVLVADYLQVSQYLSHSPWWQFKDSIDRKGGFRVARDFGLDSLDPLHSPLESFMLRQFSQNPLSIYQQMKLFATDLIENGRALEEQIAVWEKCQMVQIKDKRVAIALTEDTSGSLPFFDTLNDPPHIRINYDSRGEGWSLSTVRDAEGVDFARIAHLPEIKFAHKNGFIAKTHERLPLDKVLQLVEQALHPAKNIAV